MHPLEKHVLDRRWPLPLLGVCAMTDTSRVRELLDAANKTRSFTDSDGVVGLLILAIERLCDEVDNHEHTYVGPTGLGGRFYTTQPQRDTDGAAHGAVHEGPAGQEEAMSADDILDGHECAGATRVKHKRPRRLALLCGGCGCDHSESWVFIVGRTRLGNPNGRERFAHVRLCADCQVERVDDITMFINGLADGWVSWREEVWP